MAGIATTAAAMAAFLGLRTWRDSLVGTTIYSLRIELRSVAFQLQADVFTLLDSYKPPIFDPRLEHTIDISKQMFLEHLTNYFSQDVESINVKRQKLATLAMSGALSRELRTHLMNEVYRVTELADRPRAAIRLITLSHELGKEMTEIVLGVQNGWDIPIDILLGSPGNSAKREYKQGFAEAVLAFENFVDTELQ